MHMVRLFRKVDKMNDDILIFDGKSVNIPIKSEVDKWEFKMVTEDMDQIDGYFYEKYGLAAVIGESWQFYLPPPQYMRYRIDGIYRTEKCTEKALYADLLWGLEYLTYYETTQDKNLYMWDIRLFNNNKIKYLAVLCGWACVSLCDYFDSNFTDKELLINVYKLHSLILNYLLSLPDKTRAGIKTAIRKSYKDSLLTEDEKSILIELSKRHTKLKQETIYKEIKTSKGSSKHRQAKFFYNFLKMETKA